MTEKSKVFIALGKKVGIYQPRFTHRGIIARKILARFDELELKEFERSVPNLFTFNYAGR